MHEEIKAQIKVVIETRERTWLARDALRASKEHWEEENRVLINEAAKSIELLQDEEWLRILTLEAYRATGDKSPVPGVGVREVTKLDYDKVSATAWGYMHQMALKLDEVAFTRIAKAASLDFVEITTEPQATISAHLQAVK